MATKRTIAISGKIAIKRNSGNVGDWVRLEESDITETFVLSEYVTNISPFPES